MVRRPSLTPLRLALLALAAIPSIAAPSNAGAQRTVDIERFTPALDAEGFLGLQATRTPGHMRYGVSLTADVSTNSLTLGPPTTRVVDNRIGMNLAVQFGLGERVAAAFVLPFVLSQETNAALLYDGRGGLPSGGTRDPRFVLRWRFLGEGSREDGSRTEGPGLALQGAVHLPVGDTRGLLGEPKARTDLWVLGDFHLFGFGVGAGLGWRHRFEPQTLGQVRMRDELAASAALKAPIPWVTGLGLILETRLATDAGEPFAEGASTAAELDAGLRMLFGDFAVTAAAGPGLTEGVGVPAFRGILSLDWSPKSSDADQDGLSDSDDECPYLPEDLDGFEDEDGCLDPDNDNDLVPDEDDRCPLVAALEGRDDNEDGCTDPAQDRDGDGIDDREDACPRVAEDRDGVDDEDGCAE